jgi:hypothetical protein
MSATFWYAMQTVRFLVVGFLDESGGQASTFIWPKLPSKTLISGQRKPK